MCTNHNKFSALMSLRSRDDVQAKCTELVVIHAHMSGLLWQHTVYYRTQLKMSPITVFFQSKASF